MIKLKNIKLKENIPLANFTTLRIGGPAEWFAEPSNIDDIKTLITWAKEKSIPFSVIGAGSNLLISDNGFKGLIICTKKLLGYDLNPLNGKIFANCGEHLPTLVRRAAKAGLRGLEWAIGIPGTIGGAVVMNAGAQGGCIENNLISVMVVPKKGGQPFYLKKIDLDFSYRNSRLQKEELIVLSAFFQLEPGHNQKYISKITNENLMHRTTTQPYHLHTCGSVFRNPEPLKAGKLIEELGLKGQRIGGAEISTMHANFIVNTSNATAEDIDELITLIQNKVKKNHGFLLDPEVKRLGFLRKV